MLAHRFARMRETPVRYATSPALADYLRIVGGVHGLSPHAPPVTRPGRNPTLSALLRAALGGDHDALGASLDFLEETHGRQRPSPLQLVTPTARAGGLHSILSGLYNRSLGTDYHPHPLDVEGLFGEDSLGGNEANARLLRGSALPMYAGWAGMALPKGNDRLGDLRHILSSLTGSGFEAGGLRGVPHLLGMGHEARNLLPQDHPAQSDLRRVIGNSSDLLGTGTRNIINNSGVTF